MISVLTNNVNDKSIIFYYCFCLYVFASVITVNMSSPCKMTNNGFLTR